MGCRVFRVGVFFDGTGNNKFVDAKAGDGSASNVAKLFEFYNEHEGEVMVKGYAKPLHTARIYKEGIGTDKTRDDWHDDFWDRKSGATKIKAFLPRKDTQRKKKQLLKAVLLSGVEVHPPSFTGRFLQRRILALALVLPLLNACGESVKDYTQAKYYVDKTSFAKGRPCAEVLFNCLPESQNKAWQIIDPNDKSLIENNLPTKEQYKLAKQRVIEADKNMKLTKGMMKSFEDMEYARFIENQADNLEKEFPGFWRDVPKPVRIRWVKRAITKAKKYGYYDSEATESIQMIELCARIGLDFDIDPKWEAITKFISMPKGPSRGHAGHAWRYVDFTIFGKDYSPSGTKYTDWSLKTPLQFLPYPKRKLPSIND